MQYRFGSSYANLPSFANTYPLNQNIFVNENVDGYATGPLMTGFVQPSFLNPTTFPWSGAGNINQFFTTQDFWTAPNSTNVTATPSLFTARLASAGHGNLLPQGSPGFYEYTYYRMLAQMGMESAPEPATKINLNYKNVDGNSSSNFIPWAEDTNVPATWNNAVQFFVNAADRLLGTQTNFIILQPGTTNPTPLSTSLIPVYPINYYTPSVHRMLQLAANIYDASNPKIVSAPTNTYFDYPSVFRPVFKTDNTNIWITGYVEVTNTNPLTADYNFPAYSLLVPSNVTAIVNGIKAAGNNLANEKFNVYGVPWVIGAKKGLPNFNQVSLESFTGLTRKLQVVKSTPTATTMSQTNVQYILSVSNELMAEAWNSYAATYPRKVDIGYSDTLGMTLTNENGPVSPVVNYSTNLTLTPRSKSNSRACGHMARHRVEPFLCNDQQLLPIPA